jgi:hypothetical protein
MSYTSLFSILPGSPVTSILMWLVIAVAMLYFARIPAHRAIRSLTRFIHSAMRLTARSVLLVERRLTTRNREVLLASGRESVERAIEREFHRVDAIVRRDLSAYPALQRDLSDQITRIDEDYRESTELPPPPPSWLKAVTAVAKIPSNGDSAIARILKDIQKTTDVHYKRTMGEYRKSMSVRHGLLKRMMPYWRNLTRKLGEVEKTITGLQERAKIIDNRMEDYEQIRRKTEKAERMLSASAMTQFFISAFVLLIAFGGVVINFNLIALPMSEMVGGGSYIGQFKTSNVAALVIILVEVAMGLYLMESLRITKLFPVIGSMDDKMRHRMIWITFSILFILASVEAALAFMRDRIAADMQALRQSLAAVQAAQPVNSWIPTVGQMVMGFILPFALTFVAIPLESFVQSSRTVLGTLGAVFLRGIAFIFRLLGNVAGYLGELMVNLYDVIIMPLLWIEKLIQERRTRTEPEIKKEPVYSALQADMETEEETA